METIISLLSNAVAFLKSLSLSFIGVNINLFQVMLAMFVIGTLFTIFSGDDDE